MFAKKVKAVLMLELLFAVMVAGFAISMAMRLPVTLTKFLQKFYAKFYYQLDKTKLFDVLEKDLSTAFQPIFYSAEQINRKSDQNPSEQKDSQPSGKKIDQPAEQKKEPDALPKDSENNQEKDLIKKSSLKKFFLLNNETIETEIENKDFKSLYFFTTNNFESMSAATTRFNAILYILEEDKSRLVPSSNLFKLVRYEVKDYLNLDKLNFNELEKNPEVSQTAVVLARNIKAFAVDVKLKTDVTVKDNQDAIAQKSSQENNSAKPAEQKPEEKADQKIALQPTKDGEKKDAQGAESDAERKLKDARLPCAIRLNFVFDDRGIDMFVQKTIFVWNGFYLPEVQKERVKQKGGFKIPPKIKGSLNSIIDSAKKIMKARVA